MIDVEDKVFNALYEVIIAQYPGAYITSEYVRKPKAFPHISIMEAYNTSHVPAASLSNIDNASNLMYEVNIYSNLQSGKKTEAKDILAIINDKFSIMGFIRGSVNTVPNLEDSTIYRIVARYERVIGNSEEV